jgi:DNA-binding LacI/PurR family transcriptional regulator
MSVTQRDTKKRRRAKPVRRDTAGLHGVLRARILDGLLAPGQLLPTVRQLSDEHGVSRGMAWRALKALVGEGLVAAHSRHGYRVLARAADPDRGRPIAYVISQDNIVGGWDLYYRKLSAELESAAEERGWALMTVIAGASEPEPLFDRLAAAGACALVLDSSDPQLLEHARRIGHDAIVIDAWRPGAGMDAVVQDDFTGARCAAERGRARGGRRPAWFGQIGQSYHGRMRFGGAVAALRSAGTDFARVASVDIEDSALTERAAELLSGPDRPDGVLTLWRPAAVAIVSAARRLGLELGRDLGMVGWCAEEVYADGFAPVFDGAQVPPAVVWSARDMARAALARLAERRANPGLSEVRVTIPARLRLPR